MFVPFLPERRVRIPLTAGEHPVAGGGAAVHHHHLVHRVVHHLLHLRHLVHVEGRLHVGLHLHLLINTCLRLGSPPVRVTRTGTARVAVVTVAAATKLVIDTDVHTSTNVAVIQKHVLVNVGHQEIVFARLEFAIGHHVGDVRVGRVKITLESIRIVCVHPRIVPASFTIIAGLLLAKTTTKEIKEEAFDHSLDPANSSFNSANSNCHFVWFIIAVITCE